jgi:SHS2 domain-containing protein
MGRYEFLPHGADIRLRVEAAAMPEVFQSALNGMNHLLKPGFCERNHPVSFEHNLSLASPDSTCLLIDFLSEVLSLSHIHHGVFCGLKIESVSENKIKATVSGSAVSGFDADIKAVTYHEANLHLNDQGQWETVIIFDI